MRYEEMRLLGRRFRAYLPDATERSYYRGRRPALLVLPGGGYEFTYEGEAEPIALRFASEGIAAFVLDYTCSAPAYGGKAAYPSALQEGFAALRWIREHAAECGIDPENVTACGYSAGGHLCACLGTLWNKPEGLLAPEEMRQSRPDKLLLCYPVIRFLPPCHEGSVRGFFGELPSEDRRKAFSPQERVDAETPPAFLWATAEDDAVPVVGALQFAQALSQYGTPFELHVWPHGGHGLCLGDQVTQPIPYGSAHPSAEWTREATRFLYDKPQK